MQFQQLVSQQLHRPALTTAGRIAASQGHQEGLLLAIQFARRTGTRLVLQGPVQTAEHEALTNAFDSGHACLQALSDGCVAFTFMRQSQDVGAHQFPRCDTAFVCERFNRRLFFRR